MCTWVESPGQQCPAEGTHAELDKNGLPWAHLCDQHHQMLESAMKSAAAGTDVRILAYWVKAQGGPKKVAQAITMLQEDKRRVM